MTSSGHRDFNTGDSMANAGDIIITELMVNPNAVLDTAGEWFEIYNTTGAAIDLSGWTISDAGADTHTITSLTLAAGAVAVLGISNNTAINGGVTIDYVYSNFTLGNTTGDEVILKDDLGNVIDRVDYTIAAFPIQAGASIELKGDSYNATANDIGTNWVVATVPYGDGDLGTPGARQAAPNQAPTALDLSASSIAENNAAGAVVGTLSAVDPDTGDTFTYSLVTGTGDTDNAAFTVTGNQLKLNAAADFEAKSSYSVRLQVTDAGGLTFETAKTINVTNVNEAPTNIALSKNHVAENSAVGTVVGTLSATDPDAGSSFTYSLVSPLGGRFSVVGNEVRVARAFTLDYEQFTSHDIVVRATDNNGLSFQKTLTIAVDDVNPEIITADGSDNMIFGGALNDVIRGMGGTDLLHGDAGNDYLDGGNGVDQLEGNSGNDTYIVDNAGDVTTETSSTGGIDIVFSSVTRTLGVNIEKLTLTGALAISGTGNEIANTLTGNGAANSLSGLGGNDSLSGGGGNDTLNGGTGSDTMNGGAGDDIYYWREGQTIVEATSGGTDTIHHSGFTFAVIPTNVENFIQDLNLNMEIQGNSLNNAITGNAGSDTILGSFGNDSLFGAGGVDYLQGDSGNDYLDGGAGNDVLTGGVGNDTYVVNSASDTVAEASAAGLDNVISTVTHALGFGVENLTLSGNGAINGTGNELANVITGNGAANTLKGFVGNDTLIGGAGNDTLVGEASRDVMTGGLGADRFDFNVAFESGKTAATRDIITDFTHNATLALSDRIDLSTIDANGAGAGNTAFVLLATKGAAFTGLAGQLRWFQSDSTNNALDKTIIEGDINGDKVADFQIELTGLKNLVAADFVL